MNAGMKDMLNVMSKFLALGLSLEDVIARVHLEPGARDQARGARQPVGRRAGRRRRAARSQTGRFGFIDSFGGRLKADKKLVCEMTLRDGKVVYDLERPGAPRLGDAAEGLPQHRRPALGRLQQEVRWRRRIAGSSCSAPERRLAASAAAKPARAHDDKPVKKVHWKDGKKPEKTPLFSGVTSYGGLVFIAGVGAHFEGDIKAHTKHVLDEIKKQARERSARRWRRS